MNHEKPWKVFKLRENILQVELWRGSSGSSAEKVELGEMNAELRREVIITPGLAWTRVVVAAVETGSYILIMFRK